VPGVDDDVEALFIRRAEFPGDPWSGHMALPGGRWQAGDVDLLDTAIREAHEETAVVLAKASHFGTLDDFTPRTPVLPRIVVRPHVFSLPLKPDVILSNEVAGYNWISLRALGDARREIELDIRGAPTRVSALVIGPVVVWGLTERIITPFIELAAIIGR
jgi:8-oxo-dGTP pyrophosphatase MutT (NUDIX family)